MEFLGHGGTAHDGAGLEHRDPQSAAREVAGADEAVVAAADDDDVGEAGIAGLHGRQSQRGLRARQGHRLRSLRSVRSRLGNGRLPEGGCRVHRALTRPETPSILLFGFRVCI